MRIAVLPEKFILQSGQEKHSFRLYCTISAMQKKGGIRLNESRRRLVITVAERTKQHNGTGDSGNGRICW